QSQQKESQSQNEPNQEQENGQENQQENDNQNSNGGQEQGDDHSLWEEAFREQQEGQGKKQGQNAKEQEQSQTESQEQVEEQITMDFDERGEFEDNRKEKRERFKAKREETEKNIRSTQNEIIKLDNIGESKEAIDWKLLIRREIDKAETIWSQRRSIAENNYAYRLEENDIEDEAETEVMIDVSGSVSFSMVKEFLRQLKPLLKHSKLKVGCFDDEFYGFKEIKTNRDIDNFSSRGGGGTDFDLALKNFTNKHAINKIVFTDGEDFVTNNDYNKSIQNVFWVVYGNRNFDPCCGKVFQVEESEFYNLIKNENNNNNEFTM
ncbi:MAG: hypothetical protein IKA31_05330, partial [Clostridia bacterium]|nr:hypothetical protein [Clostridia bacterium]